MNSAILGAGALGCYYGARLTQAGHQVTFIMRSAYEPVQQNGLTIRSIFGDIHLPQPRIARSSEECGPVDLVIVCWKTTCNAGLQHALLPLLHENTRVLTYCAVCACGARIHWPLFCVRDDGYPRHY